MRTKGKGALLAAALLLALLAGCGVEPAPQPVPTEPPAPTTAPPTTVTPQPEIHEARPPKGPVDRLDITSLTRGGLSIQHLFVCDAETLLVFVSPVGGDGTISENLLVYSYSFALGGFRPASFSAGVISLYPSGVLDDGQVTLVTLDSESYAPDSLIFLDPVTLEARRAPLPPDDFYDLHISPNGQYVAITTHDYLRVTDMSYGVEHLRIDSRSVEMPDEDEEVFWDEWLPVATGWTPDSRTLCYKVMSWDDMPPPGMVDTAGWTVTEAGELAGCALIPVGGGLYTFHGVYHDLPAGLYGGAGRLYPVEGPLPAAGEEVTAVVGHPSGVLCLLTLEQENGGGTAYVVDVFSGELVGTFSGIDMPLAFEQAAFTPDGNRLVLLARPVGGGARQIITWDIKAP